MRYRLQRHDGTDCSAGTDYGTDYSATHGTDSAPCFTPTNVKLGVFNSLQK